MEAIRIKCPAKINLALDVIGKRSDGYHDLDMIMQTISLFDELTLKKTEETGIFIDCINKDVPVDEHNICWRIARILFDRFGLSGGISIHINKTIPVAAGLAGGSADAAGVIIGINRLYELCLSEQDMMELGKMVGADVPFCIHRGTAQVQGIGEQITRLKSFKANIVLAKPDISVSTASIFNELKLDEIVKRPDMQLLIHSIEHSDLETLSENMVNVLETVTIKKHGIIEEIKNIMHQFGALGSLMSGSGPSVFGIFENKASAEKCYHRLRDYLKQVYLVEAVDVEAAE